MVDTIMTSVNCGILAYLILRKLYTVSLQLDPNDPQLFYLNFGDIKQGDAFEIVVHWFQPLIFEQVIKDLLSSFGITKTWTSAHWWCAETSIDDIILMWYYIPALQQDYIAITQGFNKLISMIAKPYFIKNIIGYVLLQRCYKQKILFPLLKSLALV